MLKWIGAMVMSGLAFAVLGGPDGKGIQPARPADQVLISQTLNNLHDAASKADGKAYFELFAPDAVFLGTDATERWTLEEFKTYAMKRFEAGKGWTYTLKPGTRHITFGPCHTIAWFDELLENAKYGTCRGSGVLREIDGKWRIAQYNLTLTVPNEAAEQVVKVIRELKPTGSAPQ